MGALHKGHISLIQRCKEENEVSICSIFVNPTQFSDPADLARYPRTLEADIKLLEKAGCQVVFTPKSEEIYPKNQKKAPQLGKITEVLEGFYRPGHFEGVAQVVQRFFEIIKPHKAYFGSKDYQQVLVIKKLAASMPSAPEIISCPIIREPDGLAMSSRNMLLNAEERQIASLLPELMRSAAMIAKTKGIAAARNAVQELVKQQALMKLEYYEICHPETLEPATEAAGAVSLIAVFVGRIRLIDNYLL